MKTSRCSIILVLFGALLLAGCSSEARVGALRTESQSVELGDARSVRVEINLGAGNLDLMGGAGKLLDADFTYNAARLKPEVRYMAGTLVVRQPDVQGLPVLRNITDFRNEWRLRFSDKAPMDLSVHVGAGTSHLLLAGLELTRLSLNLGAGRSTVNLRGDWVHDLDAAIDTGAADIIVRLPREVGVRVEVDAGPTVIEAPHLTKHQNVYTNPAYGVSPVTLQVYMKAGVGRINLEAEEATATSDTAAVHE